MDAGLPRVNMAGHVTTQITVEDLVKRYGAVAALAGVSFEIAAGEIVALLGPNGAGKSTTLAVLATLLPFDAGTVTIAGHQLPDGAERARRVLGLVPQRVAVYPTLSARENLVFFARTAGLRPRAVADGVAAALEAVGLAGRADEPVARLSGGMRRRLNLACGILHRPGIVLLDEPVVGVDPQSRERIFDAVTALARDGAAVLYSTHQMDEAERLCQRVLLLDHGRVVAAGTSAALVAHAGMSPRLELRTTRPLPSGWLDGVPGSTVVYADDGATMVTVGDTAIVPAVLAAALRAGGDVREMTLHRPTLADAFFALTGRGLRDDDADAAPAA
jgi:linearmycin/streptolysin S transport system ATP-binding protein